MKQLLFHIIILSLFSTALKAQENNSYVSDTDSLADPSVTALSEIVVETPLVRREADRIVLNVAANPLSAGKDVQELLKTAPGVWATDDALSIYGQSGTAVYIDDRKINMSGSQLMTYLKTIRASDIATIEIIPKAGAEYSADSAGGVIRINLKRRRVDGISGSAGLNVTAGKYKQWYNPFANVSLHSGKWTANVSGNLNGSPSDSYTLYPYSTNAAEALSLNGVSHSKNKSLQGTFMAAVFFDPSDSDRLGLQFDYNSDRTHHISDSRTETYIGAESAGTTYGNYANHDRFHNFNATFNWSHSLDDEGSVIKLISTYNYQHSAVDENNMMSWSHTPKDSVYTTDNSNRYNIFVTDLSLRKSFSQVLNMTVGARYTFNDIAYKSSHHYLDGVTWVDNYAYDYDDIHNENIAAVYTSANAQTGRWKFKAGLRGEYFHLGTHHEGTVSNNGFDLFPNANVAFNLTERGEYTAALGYYRNIRRPSFQSLNPVVKQESDYSYSVGNPVLTPSFTNAVSLDFVLASRFTIATGYSQTANPIRQMFVSDPDYPERMYLTWANIGKDRNMFIHGDGFLRLTKWWTLYSSLTYVLTSQQLEANHSYDTFGYVRLVVSTTFLLPEDFSITANCFYNSKMRIGNITIYPILNLNPTIQKRFGKRWTLSLSFEDLLQRKNKIRTTSSGYDRLTRSKNYLTAKLALTYNFNSGKTFRSPRIEKNADTSRLTKE
ncbi:MAG: TonB-dependent receptor [Muribaculaceae bacterium]|nr:TonB-dependent receptor [Muribaculaceae bacterium]